MTPGVSAQITHLRASALDRIAAKYAADMRPRWGDNSVFWSKLLEAATGSDDDALSAVHLHYMQLLGSKFDLSYG